MVRSHIISSSIRLKVSGLLFTFCILSGSLFAQDRGGIYGDDNRTYNTIPETRTDTGTFWKLVRTTNRLRFTAPDTCLVLYHRILDMSRAMHYTDGTAEALIGISILYHDKGDLKESLRILHMARPFCELSTFDNGHYIIMMNNNFAALYTERNITDSAAYYYYESLRQYEQRKSNDTSLLLMIYGNLGGLWINDKQYDLALQYLAKAYTIVEALKDDTKKGEVYCNLAEAYGGKSMYDTAIFYGKQALIYSQKSNNTYLEKYTAYEVGSFYLHKGQPITAISYFRNTLATDNLPVYLRILANNSMAKAYHQLKKYTTAEEYYLNVLNLNDVYNYRSDLAETYNDLASLYADTKNYKDALKYKNLSSNIKDSALNAEKIRATSHMEVKFRTSEKDKELVKNQLLLTQQELKLKQKNILFGSLLGGFMLLSALSIMVYIGAKRRRRLQQTQIAGMQKEQVIAQLKAKIAGGEEERIRIARELHDGIMVQFSSVKMNLSSLLNGTTDLKEKRSILNIVDQLDTATRELRKSAHNLMPDMLLEEGLTEAVHYFLGGIRQASGIEIEFQQYGQAQHISPEYALMIYRIIQELAQNTIKHAHATLLLIQLNYSEHILTLTVEDNGVGFHAEEKTAGIGLKNIRSRVLSLYGNMEINSKPGVGTTVYIEFEMQHFKNTETYAYQGSYNR